MKRNHVAALAVLLTLTASSPAEAARSRPYLGFLHVIAEPRTPAEVEQIWALSEHVLEPHDPALRAHELVITPETLVRLRSLGLPVRVSPIDPQRWIDGLYNQAERPARELYAAGSLGIFGAFFSRVPTLEAIHAYLDELAGLSDGRAKVVVLGKSVQGRDIKAIRISTLPEGSARPGVVVIGTQHAREWASPVVTMGLIDGLVRQYPVDPAVKRVVDNLEVFINPVNNPDGYAATFDGRRLQRRNMNSPCNVDLNRNYATAWGAGVRDACGSDTYPGGMAFSEPESQAIRRLVESLEQPALLFDYHSTAAQVMIPYAYSTMRPPGYERNRELCELYSSTLRGVRGTNYPARPGYNLGRGQGGGAFDWFRANHADTMVVELGGGSGFSISNQELIPYAEENFVAWLAVVGRLVGESPLADAAAPERPTDAAAPPDLRRDSVPGDSAAPDRAPAAPEAAAPEAAPAPSVADESAGDGGAAPGSSEGGTTSGPMGGPDGTTGGCACAVGERSGDDAPPLGPAALVLLALALRRRRTGQPPRES